MERDSTCHAVTPEFLSAIVYFFVDFGPHSLANAGALCVTMLADAGVKQPSANKIYLEDDE
jgi:hypothetical protein